MKIAPRFSLVFVVAALVPLIIIGGAGIYFLKQFGDQAIEDSREMTLANEKLRLQQLAEDKAKSVNQFLSSFFKDVELLKVQTEHYITHYPKTSGSYLAELYPDKERAGLPGYGYIHPTHGAYANWDRRGYQGSVWMRRMIVERAVREPEFQKQLNEMLHKTMLSAPLLESLYKKDTNACELMWIVCNLGFATTYPNDYGHRLQVNPGLNQLDENLEDYVRLFDSTNNPQREIRWMETYLDAIKRTYMVSCVAPFYDGDRFLGTLGMDVIMSGWTHVLSQAPVGKQGYVFLISSNSVPLSVPIHGICDLTTNVAQQKALQELFKQTDQQVWTTNMLEAMKLPLLKTAAPAFSGILSRMIQQKKGVETVVMADNIEKIVAFCPAGQAGWCIGVVLPMAEAHASIDSAQMRISQWLRGYSYALFASICLVGLVAGIVGALSGIRFVRPLNAMIESISRVSRGGAWQEIKAQTHDELCVLADSANQMVRKISEGEKLLEAIFNGVSEAIFLHDPQDGRILRVNRKMCEMFSCSEEDALRLNIEYFSSGIPPYTQKEAIRNLKSALAGESPVFEWQCKDLQGRLFWSEISLKRAEVGGEIGILATVRNISERKQAEQQNRLLAQTLKSAQDCISITDLDNRILFVNQAFLKTFGYSENELLGRDIRMVRAVQPAVEPSEDEVLQSTRQDGWHGELINRRKDGTEFHIELWTSLVRDNSGAPIAMVGVGRDITEKIRLEEMVVQSEKMLSVGGLAAGMAHEINNPLAGIIQNAQVMKDRLTADMPRNVKAAQEAGVTMEAIRQYMEQREIVAMLAAIIEGGSRAAQIVQNMLSFSRKSDSVLIARNLPELIDRTIELAGNDYDLKKKYDFRQITIVREYEPGLPLVPCDASKLQQVLLNLLTNGAQAMAGMTDRHAQFVLRIKKENTWALIEVEDNGAGMIEEVRKRVFEPFFTTKDVGVGTGLGLSVSYFIITQNHGGTLEVESKLGHGTCFIIRLPLKREGKEHKILRVSSSTDHQNGVNHG